MALFLQILEFGFAAEKDLVIDKLPEDAIRQLVKPREAVPPVFEQIEILPHAVCVWPSLDILAAGSVQYGGRGRVWRGVLISLRFCH